MSVWDAEMARHTRDPLLAHRVRDTSVHLVRVDDVRDLLRVDGPGDARPMILEE